MMAEAFKDGRSSKRTAPKGALLARLRRLQATAVCALLRK
jgi:hypothetical protein